MYVFEYLVIECGTIRRCGLVGVGVALEEVVTMGVDFAVMYA